MPIIEIATGVKPDMADGITVTSGTPAWTLGAFSSDLIPANTINHNIRIFNIVRLDGDAKNYEVILFAGPSDIEIAQIPGIDKSINMPTATVLIPANNRVRAKLRGSETGKKVIIKLVFSYVETQGYRDF
jgi:hypothetical protein